MGDNMTVFILKIMLPCLNIIYFFIKLFPVQNKIVMISRQSNNVGLDFKLLGDELGKNHKVVYLCKTLDGGVKSKFKTRIIYFFHMFRQMYHLATSKVCILDSYCPTVSVLNHKKKLTIIQIWHSVGSMKKFGYTVLGKKEASNMEIAKIMKMHQNYSFICASSENYVDHVASGFGVDKDKIKIYTLPRIDLLKDKNYEQKIKNKIYNNYPELKNKQNIVYAPTFRKDESEFNKYLSKLVDSFDFNKYNLIVKLHPLSKVVVKNKKVIVDKEFSTFDMLFITDKLISDYSCVIYEAGVRNIPLYFYNYDIDKYLDVRGIAIDYDELPGFAEKDASLLVKDFEKEYDMKYLEKFIKKYVSNTNDCTKRMVLKIEEYMK